MITAVWMVFIIAPRESTMGDVQRIFYFHVSSAWVGFLGFFVTFVAGCLYLIHRERRWDTLGLASVEVGLTFITTAVVTGSLWAKPVWGTYWAWEPRLTISAIQLLIYVAYHMLRSSVEDDERKARFTAVYGIAAFVSVPFSWYAIRWWRTIHPVILTAGGGMNMVPRMAFTLGAALLASTLLYVVLVWLRMCLERDRIELVELRRVMMKSR
jgi:heme exporter protein C